MSSAPPPLLQRLDDRLRPAWARLAPRERLAVAAAAGVVGLSLLWALGVAPALTTLRQASDQHRQLDAQLDAMRGMAAAAQQLRQQGEGQSLSPETARRALQQATSDTLGASAQLALQGPQATITLRGVSPEALARWLEQVRINARVVPVRADLQRGGDPAGWTGQLVLGGPGLGAGN